MGVSVPIPYVKQAVMLLCMASGQTVLIVQRFLESLTANFGVFHVDSITWELNHRYYRLSMATDQNLTKHACTCAGSDIILTLQTIRIYSTGTQPSLSADARTHIVCI